MAFLTALEASYRLRVRQRSGPRFPSRTAWAGVAMVALLVSVAAFWGCASDPNAVPTAEEWVRANTGAIRQLQSYDEKERREGVTRFKALGREQGSSVAFWILSDPAVDNYRLEVMLAWLLAGWKDRRAIPFLLESLKLPDDGAVRVASEGLLIFGDDPRILDHLEEMLDRESVRDRETASRLLREIGTRRAVEMLATRIRSEPYVEIRAQMVIAVTQSRHPRRLEFLIDALTDQDEAIRDLAWRAIQGYPGIPAVQYSPSGTDLDRSRAVAALRLWMRQLK